MSTYYKNIVKDLKYQIEALDDDKRALIQVSNDKINGMMTHISMITSYCEKLQKELQEAEDQIVSQKKYISKLEKQAGGSILRTNSTQNFIRKIQQDRKYKKHLLVI